MRLAELAGGALMYEHKFTLSEVKFEIDNWPKVGDALYREPELVISKRIQYVVEAINPAVSQGCDNQLRDLHTASHC